MQNTLRKTAVRISKETAWLLLSVVCAVALPQCLHMAGAALGIGGALGQILLPMYLPVLVIGACRGAVPGALAGLVSPLVSFALTMMPGEALLPYITVELVVLGCMIGIFSGRRMPVVCRVLSALVIAKAVRLAAHAAALYVTVGAVDTSVLFAGLLLSLPGVALQLLVMSYMMYRKGLRRYG